MRRRSRSRTPAVAALLVLLLAGAQTSGAADSTVAAMLRELDRAGARVATLRARFVQEKHLAIVRDVLRSSGTFLLNKKIGVVWNVVEPERARVVVRKDGVFVDGHRVQEALPEDAIEDAGISPVAMLESLNGIFAGLSERTARDFEVIRLGDDRLRLKPRAAVLAAWLSALEVTLDPKTRTPVEVRIEEPGGDWTEITFTDLVLNPPLGAAAFAP